MFRRALRSDISDVQDGTTREGVHLGAMAGTLDVVQRCYTGLELRNDVLWIDPRLPDEVRRLALRVRYRTHVLDLEIAHDVLAVSAAHCEIPSMKIGVRGEVHELAPGERRSFALAPAPRASVLAHPDAERT